MLKIKELDKRGEKKVLKTKLKKTLLITLCFLFTFTTFVNANGTRLNIKPDGAIRVYDNSMVWMGYEKGQWDIYHLNIATNSQTNITKDSNVQGYPDVWDKYIVWQEKSPGEDFHIYIYDMNTGVKEKISEGTGRNQEPRISQDKVIWTNENSSGKKVVMLYDIKDHRIKQISSKDAMAFGLVNVNIRFNIFANIIINTFANYCFELPLDILSFVL